MVGHNERWSDEKLESLKICLDAHIVASDARDSEMQDQISEIAKSVKSLNEILLQGKGVLFAGKVMAALGVATATFVGAAWTVWTFVVDNFHITQK